MARSAAKKRAPADSKPWWKRYWKAFTGVAAVLGTVVAFAGDIGRIRTSVYGFIPPSIDVAWLNGWTPQLGQPIELDPYNVEPNTHRVRLPLLLAVRNREWWPLTVAAVELTVGDSIVLRSQARTKLQPGHAVREHDGFRLQPSPAFMPVAQTDTLVLPIETGTLGWLVLTDKKLPVVFPWRVAARQQRLLDTASVDIQVVVYFEHRPKYEEHMRFAVPPLLDAQWPNGRGLLPPSAADRRRFAALSRGRGQVAARWTEPYRPTGDTITYRRCRLDGGGYQAFSVNGLLRAVAADTNSDGLLDFELLDLDGDGHLDRRGLTRGVARRVILWGPEVVRINAHENRNALLYMAQRISTLEH